MLSEFVDIALDDNNDMTIGPNGDFVLTDGFDTSLKVSLFADARASADEVATPQLRRGWWGNLFLDNEIGSKLWLLDQAENSQKTLNQAINYAQLALQWITEGSYADSVSVTGTQSVDGITLTICIEKNGSVITERSYQLWRNTV